MPTGAVLLNQDTASVMFAEQRDFYVKPSEMAELYPSVMPFIHLLNSKGRVDTKGKTDFKMFEHRSGFFNQYFLANDAPATETWAVAGAPGDTVSIVCDGANNLGGSIGAHLIRMTVDIYDNAFLGVSPQSASYKGYAIVTAVSGNTVTFKALGNSEASNNACAALADNDVFFVRGAWSAENSVAPEAFSDEVSVVYNSVGWIETVAEVSITVRETMLRGEASEFLRIRKEKTKEHLWKLENMILYSHRSGGTGMGQGSESFSVHQTDADSKTIRTSMGILPALNRYGSTSGSDQNVFDLKFASNDYDQWVDILRQVNRIPGQSESRIALTTNKVIGHFSKVTKGAGFLGQSGTEFHLVPGKDDADGFGFNVRRLHTPFDDLLLVRCRALEDGYHDGHMIIIDKDLCDLYQFRGDEFMQNVKTENAYKGQKDVWRSYVGLGIELIEKHSLIKLS